ncbi:MAG: YceK/YidQ family lipoprotein [Nitrospirae bacterium]|nr:YceK/YidQ family lipoprotein [Nitrospirota bacterium]
MRQSFCRLFLWTFAALAMALAGCGTIRTIPLLESSGSPKIYTGTRLDFHAITGNESRLTKFKTNPPAYPWIDLPFSLIADTLIFPVSSPVATYEFLFESHGER